jgi:tetratricopeptide (TPR) repeat protein
LGESARVISFVSDIAALPRSDFLAIPTLTSEAVSEVVAARGIRMTDEGIRQLHRVTSGIPANLLMGIEFLRSRTTEIEDIPSMDALATAFVSTLSLDSRALLSIIDQFAVYDDDTILARLGAVLSRDLTRAREELGRAGMLRETSSDEPMALLTVIAPLAGGGISEADSVTAGAELVRAAGEAFARGVGKAETDRLESLRLQYELVIDSQRAVDNLRRLVRRSLSEFDLDQVNALIALAERQVLPQDAGVRVAHLRARYFLEDFDSVAAWSNLQSFERRARSSADKRLLAEHQLLEARCATSPAPMPNGDLFDAIQRLGLAAGSLETDDPLYPELAMTKGRAHRSTGQTADSISAYQDAVTAGVRLHDYDIALAAKQELVQSFRYMQDLSSARQSLDDAYRFKGAHDISSPAGKLEYYAANLSRDEGNFDTAREMYESSRRLISVAGDENGLCCLYGDWAWLEYLDGKNDVARAYLESSYEIAKRYGFGAEVAEYWHARFHLARDEGNIDDARRFIQLGAVEANRSSNIYMVLDCGMHMADLFLLDSDVSGIESVLSEMEALENRGCGIKVFRGRTRILRAAALLVNGNRIGALEEYIQGLKTVALYGNSRTNVELFDDILEKHSQRLIELLREYKYADRLKIFWEEAGLSDRFPQVISLCDDSASRETGAIVETRHA